MATKTRKLTAANCPALARIKRLMNAPIYRECLALANGEGGLDAARAYMGRWFNDEYRERRLAEMFAD